MLKKPCFALFYAEHRIRHGGMHDGPWSQADRSFPGSLLPDGHPSRSQRLLQRTPKIEDPISKLAA